MADKIEQYKAADAPLPSSYLSWDLFGAGIEHLGRAGKPVRLPLRPPRDDEVLLRVDAIGLCFSDTKLIWAGPEHPRIRGRDLESDPTVPGHEPSLTVVAVGRDWRERFRVGERYLVQADVYVNGEQKAYGYVQRGALAQYTYAGPWLLDGDEGCYLLPLQPSTGYAQAALVEPYTCVEAAYRIPQRTHTAAGGRMLVVAAPGAQPADLAGVFPQGGPSLIAALGDAKVHNAPADLAPVLDGGANPDAVARAKDRHTDGQGFDDILLLGAPDENLARACDEALAAGGVLCLLGEPPEAPVDVGRVHYHATRHVGARGGPVAEAYCANTRQDLAPGGAAWMVGAAGPMGQMHVQRALEAGDPPAKLLCTDLSDERNAALAARYAQAAGERGVELVIRNPAEAGDFDAEVRAFAPQGFDDIVIMAPAASVVEQSAAHLAPGAMLNVFAGVKPGTLARLPLSLFADKHVRCVGSSGSRLEDIRETLRKTEADEMNTNFSLAALGDVYQAWQGMQCVKQGTYPGKIVLFPHLADLGLQPLADLARSCPAAHAALGPGGSWTVDAERALFADRLPDQA